MTEFKIGDTVRVLTEREDSFYGHLLSKGELGMVHTILDESGAIVVEVVNDVVQFLHPSELELVNE